jgi:hypothetical protein
VSAVEDRISVALWLELAAGEASDYEERARRLATDPAVGAVWWGANAHPGRKDLPRTIPEFSTVGIYEVEAGFSPPPSPGPGVTGLSLVRTPRPGQGVLTGQATTGVLIVLISPRQAAGAAALRDWADFVHIRHIAEAAVPGYGMITPYVNASGLSPLYLHLYEMHSEDPEATFRSMTPRVQERLGPPGSPAFDAWAGHDQLQIDYVNTFRRAGSIAGLDPNGPAL